MSEHNIDSSGHDRTGRCYDLEDDAPIEAITVDEATGSITIYGSTIERLLADLFAMERDRLLGFPGSELHANPQKIIQQAYDVLTACGHDPDQLVLPDDQERLGLDDPDMPTDENTVPETADDIERQWRVSVAVSHYEEFTVTARSDEEARERAKFIIRDDLSQDLISTESFDISAHATPEDE